MHYIKLKLIKGFFKSKKGGGSTENSCFDKMMILVINEFCKSPLKSLKDLEL